MTVLQAWLLVGVPGLLVAVGLFVGRSVVRARTGYAVLLALAAFFAMVPTEPFSAVAFLVLAGVLLRMRRGTRAVESAPSHHQTRDLLTRSQPHPGAP